MLLKERLFFGLCGFKRGLSYRNVEHPFFDVSTLDQTWDHRPAIPTKLAGSQDDKALKILRGVAEHYKLPLLNYENVGFVKAK